MPLVPLLDPSYPCHPQCVVHMRFDEQFVDVRYERHCPICEKPWFVIRRPRMFDGRRFDELEWIERKET